MRPDESEGALTKRLGRPLEALTARRALRAMLGFYVGQRAEDVDVDEDGDMLLFEWGVYGFTGPESFQFTLTRQFIVTGEDEPYQLHLTLHFDPDDALRAIPGGSRWCRSPGESSAFGQFVESSAPFNAVADAEPSRVELYFEQC